MLSRCSAASSQSSKTSALFSSSIQRWTGFLRVYQLTSRCRSVSRADDGEDSMVNYHESGSMESHLVPEGGHVDNDPPDGQDDAHGLPRARRSGSGSGSGIGYQADIDACSSRDAWMHVSEPASQVRSGQVRRQASRCAPAAASRRSIGLIR